MIKFLIVLTIVIIAAIVLFWKQIRNAIVGIAEFFGGL